MSRYGFVSDDLDMRDPSVPTQNTILIIGSVVAACILSLGAAGAETCRPGHGALEIWNAEGRANAPEWVQTWLRIMMATFLVGIFFVWHRVEARWVVGGVVLGLLTSRALGTYTDIVMLSGLVALIHLIFWSPGLYLLLTRRPFLGERSAYATWSGAATLVILFSFFFDIRDAAIYLDHITGLRLIS